MLLRLRLLMITLGSGAALLVVLCLGAQNLSDRYRLRLGIGETAPLRGFCRWRECRAGGSAVAV